MPYFNTTHQTGQTLIEFSEKAGKQDDIVYSVFKERPSNCMTPFEVQEIIEMTGKKYPITSIRRSITTLTENGKLRKSQTAEKCGNYGRPNYTWRFNDAPALVG
jgi:hypothetical protein